MLRYEDIDLETARRVVEHYSSVADDFTSARGDVEWSMTFSRSGWSARTVTRTVLTCTPTTFDVYAQLDAFEGDRRIFSRNWERTIPRDCL